MKKILTTLLMATSLLCTAFGNPYIKKPANDSLIGFWKTDTLNIEEATPAVFPDFIIQVIGTSIVLKWTTASKTAVAYFEIQRSSDLNNWVSIATLLPQASNVYEYADAAFDMQGMVYYRIRQVDNNKIENFSIVRVININGDNRFLVWPNPVSDVLFIQTHLITGTIEIADATGRLIKKLAINNTIMSIPVNTLPGGIYIARIRYHEFVFTANFIKH